MILHLGVAPDQAHFSLERQAHRGGYDQHKDMENHLLECEDGPRYWPDLPDELQTSLNFDDVYDTWRSNLLRTPDVSPELERVVVRQSEDAGHFICDFMYYAMLAEYQKRRKDAQCAAEERPVIFLHIPGEGTAGHIKQGLVVTRILIRSLAECWMRRMEVYEETHDSPEQSSDD